MRQIEHWKCSLLFLYGKVRKGGGWAGKGKGEYREVKERVGRERRAWKSIHPCVSLKSISVLQNI